MSRPAAHLIDLLIRSPAGEYLKSRGIDTVLICDNMAAQVMKEGKVQLVIVGADRIAASGDVANKIGTYSVAVLAQAHTLPFYVAAPTSTVDLSIETGEEIPIEERDPAEGLDGHTAWRVIPLLWERLRS